MSIVEHLKSLFQRFFRRKKEPVEEESIYVGEEIVEEVHSLWDYIKINAQSQAHHICSVLGFEEWVSMDEILRRIKEMFGVAYKNERSLYPYIKTLVDCGLLEASGFAGKKHWRKGDLVIKIEGRRESKRAKQEITIGVEKTNN